MTTSAFVKAGEILLWRIQGGNGLTAVAIAKGMAFTAQATFCGSAYITELDNDQAYFELVMARDEGLAEIAQFFGSVGDIY